MRAQYIGKAQIVLLVIMILLGCILICSASECGVAAAEESAVGGIDNYIQSLYNTKSQLENRMTINVMGDDPIIDYVPKELFKEEGETLYIGEDYGYYIYTFADAVDTLLSPRDYTGNMHSFLLVFTITYSVNAPNNSTTADMFSYTIKPIFQREYATLMPGGSNVVGLPDYTIGNFYDKISLDAFISMYYRQGIMCLAQDGVSLDDGLVVPIPQRVGDFENEYKDVNVFYLTDIAVGAEILNEQELNKGDSGYAVSDDDGSFMIGTGYRLEAVEYVEGSYDWGQVTSDLVEFAAKNVVTTVIGALDVTGVFMNGIFYGLDIIDIVASNYTSDSFTSVSGGDYYGSGRDELPNTKVGQIDEAGSLYKDAAVFLNEANGSNVWLGKGHTFEAIFEVSGSTGNDPGWKTVVQASVRVGINGLIEECSHQEAEFSGYTNTFNSKKDKQLCEDETQEAYVMAPIEGAVEGKDFFVFTPDETGFYTLDVSGSGVNVDVARENKVSLTASGLGYLLEEGENYYITLINTTTSLQRPSITVSATELAADYQDSYVFTVPADTSVTVGVDLVNMFTNVEVAGVGVTITCLSTTDNVWVEYANTTSIDVDRQKVERIEISNTSASPQNCTITFSAPPQLSTDGAQTVTISDRTSYFRFVPQAEAYVFEWCDVPEGATINFTIYGTDDAYSNVSMRQDSVFVTGLTEGQTYWIGLYDAVATAAEEIELAVDEQPGISIKWCIDDVVVETNSVTLYNGRSYDVAICINDQKYYFPHEYRFTTTEEYITFTENGLTVSFQENDNIISMESSLVYSIPEEVWISFSGERMVMIDLEICLVDAVNKVTGEGSLQLVDAHNYADFERVTAKVTDSKITSLHYLVRYQDWKFDWQELTGEAEVVTGADDTFQFDFDFNETIAYETSVKITHMDYDGYCFAFPDTEYPSIEFPVTIGGGDGTAEDPFLLMCERHYLTFITQISYFESQGEADDMHWLMMDDIDISDLGSYEIDVFRGNFDGGGHTLSGFTIEIPATAYTSDKNFGWVNTNYGTIKNVTFSDVVITAPVCHSGAWVNVGAVVGVNEAGAVIDDVSISNIDIDVNRNMSCIGGVAGVNKGTISNCFADGGSEHPVLLFGNGDMGVFCGKNSGQVESCNANLVSLEHYPSVANRSIGGVVGYCESGEIKDCYILLCMISVTGTDAGICPNIGGIAGHVANVNMLVNNTNVCLMDLEVLTDAQKVNCCEDGSRDYGCVG